MRRPRFVLAIAVTAMAVASITPALAASSDAATTCKKQRFSVAAGGLSTDTYAVSGELCGRRPANKHTLLITSHGATYNHLYWDWPQKPSVRSFVRNQPAKVSVLNIDLLGSGASSHPVSAALTLQMQASMIHQLVARMRSRGFKYVILVGHSSGSGVATQEASTYHDVDGLIVTGFFHRLKPPVPPPGGAAVPLSLFPAMLDPAFATKGLDAGYFTTRPGARGNVGFYNPATADPAVIAYDDAHKDTVSGPHVAGFAVLLNDPSVSRAVDIPVLSVVGNFDTFCDSPACPQAAEEPAAWSPRAQLEIHLIPDAGHCIHLHDVTHAQAEFRYVREWLDRRFA
jgi:pimeloyl-ACP methyl ester carboxylesterase